MNWTIYRNKETGIEEQVAVVTKDNLADAQQYLGTVKPGDVLYYEPLARNGNGRYTWSDQNYLNQNYTLVIPTTPPPFSEVTPVTDDNTTALNRHQALRRAGQLADDGFPDAASIWVRIAELL